MGKGAYQVECWAIELGHRFADSIVAAPRNAELALIHAVLYDAYHAVAQNRLFKFATPLPCLREPLPAKSSL